jgi:integrase
VCRRSCSERTTATRRRHRPGRQPASHPFPENPTDANQRLEALFVVSITLGLRPGELRKLTWGHIDLGGGVVHVWKSASKTGDTKTPKSKRSLILPNRAITALRAHMVRQDRERAAAGAAYHEDDLVFCHEDGTMYTAEALN